MYAIGGCAMYAIWGLCHVCSMGTVSCMLYGGCVVYAIWGCVVYAIGGSCHV